MVSINDTPPSVTQPATSEAVEPNVVYKITSEPGPYGFGRTWFLAVSEQRDDGTLIRHNSLYLGQGAKVAGRLLGMRMEELVDQTTGESGSEEWEDNEPLVTEMVVEALRERGATDEMLMTCVPWAVAVD